MHFCLTVEAVAADSATNRACKVLKSWTFWSKFVFTQADLLCNTAAVSGAPKRRDKKAPNASGKLAPAQASNSIVVPCSSVVLVGSGQSLSWLSNFF